MHDNSGVKLDQLFVAPFTSVQQAQISLSLSALKYFSDYGFDSSGNMKIVQINSAYYDVSSATTKDISLNIPFISLINIPSLYMTKISAEFDIAIESQTINSQDVNQPIKTSGYISSVNSDINKPKYHVHIEAINEKPLGLLMLYEFINSKRDIIRAAPGSANVNLKSYFG